MKSKKKNFRVVQKKIKGKKTRHRTWFVLGAVGVLVLVIVVGLLIHSRQTYGWIEVIGTYENAASDNGNYISYADGILRYSRDGVALFNIEGEELWNQPCQIQSPIIEMCGNTAVMGDKDGTSVLVLEQTGIKGEFQTARPIEQLAVSSQGIVAAVLKDEVTPKVVCYDAKGNVLIEQKASLVNTGYPLDIAISPDGKTLLVSYLCINETSVSTDVVYYNFSEERTKSGECEVARTTYAGQMIPTVSFLDESISLLLSDKALILWEGTGSPKELTQVSISGEIEQAAYNDRYISLVVDSEETDSRELHIYNKKGQQKTVSPLEEEYAHMTMCEREIIMYEDNRCYIQDVSGVVKYAGEIELGVETIAQIGGIMKYIVAGNNGIYKIQLKK